MNLTITLSKGTVNEEVGVYYRFTEGRAQVVAGIFMHPRFVLETEKLQAIQKKLQELFLHPEGRIPGCEQNMAIYQVELLTFQPVTSPE